MSGLQMSLGIYVNMTISLSVVVLSRQKEVLIYYSYVFSLVNKCRNYHYHGVEEGDPKIIANSPRFAELGVFTQGVPPTTTT